MALNATIASVKLALRISHSALDTDINAEINACLRDLYICGIDVDGTTLEESDPLILNAIVLWCRAAYINDVARAESLRRCYDALKGSLMMASGYGGDAATLPTPSADPVPEA